MPWGRPPGEVTGKAGAWLFGFKEAAPSPPPPTAGASPRLVNPERETEALRESDLSRMTGR